MLEAYGLAAAHLSEFQRNQDEARARYDRGLATVTVRRPGVISRLAAALFQAASRSGGLVPVMPPAGVQDDEAGASLCGGCGSRARVAA